MAERYIPEKQVEAAKAVKADSSGIEVTQIPSDHSFNGRMEIFPTIKLTPEELERSLPLLPMLDSI